MGGKNAPETAARWLMRFEAELQSLANNPERDLVLRQKNVKSPRNQAALVLKAAERLSGRIHD
jgi:hypothetical protein